MKRVEYDQCLDEKKIRWKEINDCVLACGRKHDYFDFGVTSLKEIEKIVPFEKGIAYFMDGNQKPVDYYTIRGLKEDINEYLNYYIKDNNNKHDIYHFSDGKRSSTVEVVLVDWNDDESTDFVKEYILPQKIRWMLQFMLSDNIGIPRIAFSITRNVKPFSEIEVNTIKLLAEHLENLHKKFFSSVDIVSDRKNIISGSAILTTRETEIANLVCRGVTTENIANRLKISKQTVYRHIANIYKKMNVSSKQEFLLKMMR